MSASVFKPLRHEVATRIRGGAERRQAGAAARDVQRVRRALFGPVDHEENRRMLEAELARQAKNGAAKWDFDFDAGVPITPSNRYLWSILTPPQEICKRPAKKPPPQSATQDEDTLHLYLDPLEDLINPTIICVEENALVKATEEKMVMSPVRSTSCKKQSSITDYMSVKKSSASSTAKRPKELSVSRPTKLPRTSQSNTAS